MSEPISPALPGMHRPTASIIVPVKPAAIGKSRLRSGRLAGLVHPDRLVRAIALDTIAAVRAGGAATIVVTNDDETAEVARSLGAHIVADTVTGGLNAAIRHGATQAGPGIVGALTADLPALRPEELSTALDAAVRLGRRAYVADHLGTGTTLLIAPVGVPLEPRFGSCSAAAHGDSGAIALDGDWPSLRLDVDTPDDLRAAVALGLGPRTAQALALADASA